MTSWEYGSYEALQQVFLEYDPARKPLGKPSDIWSLGLVADECMTNTLLTYRAPKAGKVFFDCIVANGDPAFVSKQFELAVATVPALIAESKELLGDDKLSRLVKNCLDLDPEKRVNIKGFMDELNDVIKELSLAQNP